VTWLLDALCRTRPSDWWDLGDDSNRLAMLICSVCPVRSSCQTGDEEPHGVIRAGVAYRDTGERCQVCPCGRPVPSRRDRPECYRCEPRWDVQVPVVRKRRRRPRQLPDSRDRRMAALRDAGVPFREIALEFRVPKSMVERAVQRVRVDLAGSVQ
jgi:hypothetical protein